MNINQEAGDRVRWEASGSDEMRYGIVVDELTDSDEADDSVLVAVYEQVPTDADDDSVEWENTNEQQPILEENLTVIDEFPTQPMSNNADGSSDGGDGDSHPQIHGNILAEARVPQYSETAAADETELESWELWWGLDEYLEAWAEETGAEYDGDPYSALSEVPEDARGWIAGHSLLGNPTAETEENLLLGAVVSPDGVLHEELLEEVLGTTGSQWTIPDEQRESARGVARQLLADEFGHEFNGVTTNAPAAEETLGAIQSLLQRVGLGNANAASDGGEPDTACDCDSGTHEGCHCTETNDDTETTTTTINTMTDFSDDDYERLANATSFGTEQLRRMEDEQLDSLNELVENAAEATDDSGDDDSSETDANDGGEDGEGDGDGSDDGVGANADDDTLPEAVENELEDLRETVNAQQEVIDDLSANREAKEQQRRERAANAIRANSEQYSDEQLEAMDTEVLETTANALQAANSSADWGGLNEPHPTQIDGNADDDGEGTSTGGSFRQYVANKQAESGD